MINYYHRRKAGQSRWISRLRGSLDEVSESEEYKENGNTGAIALTEVPYFNVELVGVPALAYLGREVFNGNPNFDHLLNENGKCRDHLSI